VSSSSEDDDEQRLRDGGIHSPQPLNTGVSATYIAKIRYADGSEDDVVVKPESGLLRGSWSPHPGISLGGDLARERASTIINRAAGNLVSSPTVVIRDVPGLGRSGVQRFIQGTTPLAAYEPWMERKILSERPDQLRKVAILDTIINNIDRHTGNLLVDRSGQLHAIDHGLSFPTKNVSAIAEAWHFQTLHRTGNARLSGRELFQVSNLLAERPAIDRELRRLGLASSIAPMWERVNWIHQNASIPTAQQFQDGNYRES
jgi:hypothetical protein